MSDIYVTSTDRKYFAKLTNYSDDAAEYSEYFLQRFALSPDGTKIVYFFFLDIKDEQGRRKGVQISTHVMNADGTAVKKLTSVITASTVIHSLWSPDSSKLLLVVKKESIEQPTMP